MMREQPTGDDTRRVHPFDAFTIAVLAVTGAAIALVGLMAVLRLATACGPVVPPRHFAPAAAIERMAEARL